MVLESNKPYIAIFNLDSLIRGVLGDIPMLIFMGLSFVPGMCSYVPFLINMYKIPPPIYSDQELLKQQVPEIAKAQENAKKEEQEGEQECLVEVKDEPSPFQANLINIPTTEQTEYEFGMEVPDEQIKKREEDYHVLNWEKTLTKPERALKYPFILNYIASNKLQRKDLIKDEKKLLKKEGKKDIDNLIKEYLKNQLEKDRINSKIHPTSTLKLPINGNPDERSMSGMGGNRRVDNYNLGG